MKLQKFLTILISSVGFLLGIIGFILAMVVGQGPTLVTGIILMFASIILLVVSLPIGVIEIKKE